MDHLKRARFLAEDVDTRLDLLGLTHRTLEQVASVGNFHAVLALIDLIQGDREEEIAELQHHITQLEADLQAARTALHVREQVTAAEMKKLKWGPPDG